MRERAVGGGWWLARVNRLTRNPVNESNQVWFLISNSTSYDDECSALCNQAKEISSTPNVTERDQRWRKEWLPKVEAFKQHWGAEMVPPDIRHTVDTVEEDLNLCPTMWPDSQCHLDEEKDASTLNPVDNYQDQFNYGIINNYENTNSVSEINCTPLAQKSN